jgi:hypothetical protein
VTVGSPADGSRVAVPERGLTAPSGCGDEMFAEMKCLRTREREKSPDVIGRSFLAERSHRTSSKGNQRDGSSERHRRRLSLGNIEPRAERRTDQRSPAQHERRCPREALIDADSSYR